jgi:hypothetical protein
MSILVIISIIFSIAWLWFGVRFNFLRIYRDAYMALVNASDKGVNEIVSHRVTEKKSKLIVTFALLCIAAVAYLCNDYSNSLFYCLAVGWILFYFVDLELFNLYNRIEKLIEENKENHSNILDRLRDLEESK